MRRALVLALLIATVAPLGAQSVKRPATTGIAFARFYTTDPPGAQKFYGGTLGFRRLESNGVWIYPVNSSQWIEILTSPPPPKPDVRMAAVAFTTRNAAGLERYLAAHGITAELPLKAGEFGVRDPEGNLVIFVQRGSNKLVAKAAPSPDATQQADHPCRLHCSRCRKRGRILARRAWFPPLLAWRQDRLQDGLPEHPGARWN